ncbi:hypothetical protein NP493_2007g00000 [Ridgeia piscesae]|uniref:Uncharacterized protein n=1 Tax=Ridgeia piscesae TaxID=27915 RepID=A0AAD9JN11_RIDPI|nr:hypothetical protein NP493_2007g00000 [Ridgeia piscesae]
MYQKRCLYTFVGESKTIGKNSLTCITFDKPYFDWRGRFTASQGIWLKNVHVLRELNCGLDRACGRFHAPSRLEIPFFNYNDFFDFSVSVWFKREGGTGCWPVLVSNGDCAQRTIQISSKDDTHLIVTVRTSAGTTYEETFVTESQSADWRHVVVTVHVGKWRVKGWTKVYIDGKKVGQGHLKGKMPPVSFPMFVGSNACGPCKFNYFNGLMDSISFSRYALTPDEVSELYSSRGLCIGLSGETEAMVVGVPKHWALIVAGSHMYHNYRHQADACHAYQIVKKNGIPEERIVLMIYDDIANHDK